MSTATQRAGRGDGREQAIPAPGAGARFAGTALAMFIYVFLGAGTEASVRVLAYRQHHALTEADWLLIALAHGIGLFTAMIITRWLGHVHANPALTVGLAVAGHFRWRLVPQELAAHLTGAVLGTAATMVVYGQVAATIGRLGAAERAPGVSLVQAMAIEGLGTAILALTVMATVADPRAPEGWGPFAAGMAVLLVTAFMGPTTSALINPARAFGPDLVDAVLGVRVDWVAFVVTYLVGPMLGASAISALYVRVAGLGPAAS